VSNVRWCVRPLQRGLGRVFDLLYVNGSRYACYDQTRYLRRHPTPVHRATGFDWTLYQVMAGERARVRAYRGDIEATVRGKTVLEIGPGPTAVFTRIAAEAGADLVVAVEANAWVAAEARRRVRGYGSRVVVLARHSDELEAAEVGGRRHFDVLVVESYHAIASQEAVVETVTRLRDNGFTFTQVISRGFSTYVAPSAAPSSAPMTVAERVAMGWPATRRRADVAMTRRISSLHGDMARIASRRLAPPQLWQQADFETGAGLTTATSLTFDVERAEEYAGVQFTNRFHFHQGVLDTGTTSTSWGVYFVPLAVPRTGVGRASFTLSTRLPHPGRSATVELGAELAGLRSTPRRL
jgi:predicted nicotinamide N-methyase